MDQEIYLVSVAVEHSTTGFETGASRRLFHFHGAVGVWCYDVALDCNRFLVTAPLEEDLVSPVTLITDWTRKIDNR